MNALASFIMRGRSQAILVISALTILSWLLSLASLLAAAAVALPTLRRGGREGGLLVLGALPVVALAGQVIMGNALQAGGYSLALWVPMLFVAVVLRETASLAIAVLAALALGLVVVAGFHLVLADPAGFWDAILQQAIKPVLEQRGADVDENLVRQTLQMFARYATGAIAAGSILTVLLSLLLARWWQSVLYNPGGFRTEFLQLRLPVSLAWTFLVLILAMSMAGGGFAEFTANFLMPMLMVYLILGFSILHAVCSKYPSGRFWLSGIYVGLMFMAPLILVIGFFGWSDSWLNWRQRLARSGT